MFSPDDGENQSAAFKNAKLHQGSTNKRLQWNNEG